MDDRIVGRSVRALKKPQTSDHRPRKNPLSKKLSCPAFVDCPLPYRDPEKSHFAVIPFGYDYTATYQKGAIRGPAALLKASTQVELFDEELRQETFRAGIATLPPTTCRSHPVKMLSRLESLVTKVLERHQFPVVIGGEHSISLACFRALKSHWGLPLTVLHLDAHADLRDSYEGTKWGHGCVIRRMLEEGAVKVVSIGLRSLSSEEAAFIEQQAGTIHTVYAHQLRQDFSLTQQALKKLPPGPLFVTIDLDVFDPSLMPGTGTPEPGGLDWYQITQIIKIASSRARIVGFDTVELKPLPLLPASDFTAAKLVYRFMGYLVRSQKIPALSPPPS